METHTSDGRRLTYSEAGSGPRLVCHPGGPGFSGAYFGGLGGVAAERTVVAVNPAGTAGSDPWTEEHTRSTAAQTTSKTFAVRSGRSSSTCSVTRPEAGSR